MLQPLWIYDGKLLDGRGRKGACDELGIVLKDTDFRVFTGTPNEALAHSVKLNLTARRQVTTTQKVAMASDTANLGHGGDRTSKIHTLGLAPVTREQAGAMYGVSVSAINEFRAIKDEALIARMRAGSLSVWEAKALVAKAEREQAEANLKEAKRLLREKKKAAPNTTSSNGGGGGKAKPSGKKSTWDPTTSKATRAYAIQTLKEQGVTTPSEEHIEQTIEAFRQCERDEAELHKQEEQTNGGGNGDEEHGEADPDPVRRRKDWSGTTYEGTCTYTAGRKAHDEAPQPDEELTEAQAAFKRGQECNTVPAIYARFDELGIGGPNWTNEVFVAEVWTLIENLVKLNGWGE